MGDALVFIDANQYLQCYRLAAGKKLLPAIKAQQEHIFITKQVVDEVQRNRLRLTADLLTSETKELEQAARCTAFTEDLRLKVSAARAKFATAARETLQQVSRSEDDVSKALAELFKTAVVEWTDELQRARLRKEKGNPPGKQNDPLGDQLTWEQLLSHTTGKSKVWIISSDQDYFAKLKGKLFLNTLLHQELAALNTPPTRVFCFDDLVDGLKDFATQTGAKADALPTEEECARNF